MEYYIGQHLEKHSTEAAIWANNNNVNPNRTYDISIEPYETGYTIVGTLIPVITSEEKLQQLKEEKLQQLEEDFTTLSESKQTFVTSSLGFNINANSNANRDISGLVKSMEIKGDTEKMFMDFDNTPQILTLVQMQTLLTEIVAFGELCYFNKWTIRSNIIACENIECVNNITWDFYLNLIKFPEENIV